MKTLVVVPNGEMTIATDAHSFIADWAKAGKFYSILQSAFNHLGCSFVWINIPQNLHIENSVYADHHKDQIVSQVQDRLLYKIYSNYIQWYK